MYQKLFEPGCINRLRLKNRIVMPAMGTGFADWNGEASEDLIAYFEARARGGAGLIITEYCRVDGVTGASSAHQLALFDMKHIAPIEKLAMALHQYDTKLFVQLYHPGLQTTSAVLGGKQIVAPSEVPNRLSGEMARALTIQECEELVEKFGKSAQMAQKAGADGVEIHAAHGYLICQFLSPYTNKRTDRYGGSLEGRMQFLTEIIQRVRQLCGRGFPISVRLSVEEFVPDGLHLEESVQIAKRLEALGVDALNVSCAIAETKQYFMEPYYLKEGWREHMSRTIKQAVSIPVIAVNTIKHPAYAEHTLEDGICDFVGLGRSQVADPEWSNKAKEGREKEIRTCIGCLYCLREYGEGRRSKCAVNPEFGRERTFQEIKRDGAGRKVVVVGGGPGGMEAARVLGMRGFDVELLEQKDVLGGTLNSANRCEGKELISEYRDYLISQLEKYGVKVQMDTQATPEMIKAMEPYAVILAGGGIPIFPKKLPGVTNSNVHMWDQVISGQVPMSNQRIAVIGGGVTGLELAELLAAPGLENQVTVVEMKPGFAEGVAPSLRGGLLEKLEQRSVKLLSGHQVQEFKPDSVVCRADGKEVVIPCDQVVLAMGVTPPAGVREAYESAGFRNFRTIGDAAKGGLIADAVREGHECAFHLK